MFPVGPAFWQNPTPPFAWYAETMPSITPQSAAYGSGVWVVAGISGANAFSVKSAGGAIWSAATTPVGSAGGYGQSSTASSGTAFVSALNAAAYGYSTDGDHWTQRAKPVAGQGRVRYLNGKFVMLNGSTYQSSIDNGLTFGSPVSFGLSWVPSDIAWDGTKYLAIGPANFATSPDLVAWTSLSAPWSSATPGVVAYGAGVCVVIPQKPATNVIYWTADRGVTWNTAALPANKIWPDLVFDGTQFLAITADATTTAISSSGTAWILGANLTATGFYYLAANGAGAYIAAPQNVGPTTLVNYGHA